jgi:hypothetical protein
MPPEKEDLFVPHRISYYPEAPANAMMLVIAEDVLYHVFLGATARRVNGAAGRPQRRAIGFRRNPRFFVGI